MKIETIQIFEDLLPIVTDIKNLPKQVQIVAKAFKKSAFDRAIEISSTQDTLEAEIVEAYEVLSQVAHYSFEDGEQWVFQCSDCDRHGLIIYSVAEKKWSYDNGSNWDPKVKEIDFNEALATAQQYFLMV